MNILLTSATEAEIAPSREYIGRGWNRVSEDIYEYKDHIITICITGAGMATTAYHLTKALLARKYDIALQVGIGGSFDRNINIGDVVFVQTEQFGDLGAEDHDNYINIFDLGLADRNSYPYSGGILTNPSEFKNISLPVVNGLTVNTVSGNEHTIKRLVEEYNCQLESMEGAAFHYACLMEKIAFAQVRAISNYIEPRDKSQWQIPLAIKNLNDWIIKFLNSA